MVATQPRATTRPAGEAPTAFRERIVKRRRGLPGSRAVVGGLLVAIAAVGVFATWSGANGSPKGRHVVAARAIAAGTVLTREDLKTVPMDLPDAVSQRSFTRVDALDRAVTLGPLEPGELVQSGNVLPGRDAERRPELSFGIDADRAVAGTLRPGDRIDILVTYGTGAGSATKLVSADARVLAIDGGARNGLSDARRQVLTVALPASDDILELTNAARAGELTVARATGVADRPGDQQTDRTFQPQVPDAGDGTASTSTVPSTSPSSAPKRSGS